MPKLPAIKPKVLIKKLEKAGFIKDHQSERGWDFPRRNSLIHSAPFSNLNPYTLFRSLEKIIS